ncbi:MAG: alpha/beta fold hydrolase [Acidobacteriota bacterium]
MSAPDRVPVRLRSTQGDSLAAFRYGDAPRAVVIAHGILAHQDLPEIRGLVDRFRRDATVYTLDFRGHGASGGKFTMGQEEHRDLAALLGIVKATHRRVGLVGFSFGGFHSVLAAAAVPVDALCLVSAPAHLRVWDHFPFGRAYFRTLPHILMRRRGRHRIGVFARPSVNPEDVIARVAAPVLVVHGTDDWIVSERHARLLHERAHGPKHLEVVPGGLHAEYLLKQDPDGIFMLLSDWINKMN